MNHSKMKRFLAMVLALVLTLGCMPVAAFADETLAENAAPETVTVSFDANGGIGAYEDQVVTKGALIAQPAEDPTHETMDFSHWTVNQEENTPWNFEEDTANEDMTLYAVWTAPAEAAAEDTEENSEEEITEEEITEEEITEEEITEEEINEEEITEEEITEEDTTGEETSEEAALFSLTRGAETQTGVYYDGVKFGYNGYYNQISRKDYVLVPGAAWEYEMVLNNDAGTRRQVIHVIEVDPSNPDVSILPGYYQIDKDLEVEANWSHKELTEMAKYYEQQLGYNIVGGMNTDLYYSSYSPRVLVYNGKSIGNFGENVATGGGVLNPTSSILYVFRDAEGKVSCDVKAFNKTEFDNYLAGGTLLHAVGVSFGMVVKDGKLVSSTEKRGSDDAARSMVGVKADGTLVLCMNDGRGANNSVGFSSFEEGEAMLALGCQWAANCDGGGSSTFLSKRVGEETFTMRSVPCDGAQRPTAHGVFVASNVGATGELNNVNIESDYDIFAPGTVYTFGAQAIDTNGYAMEMPADAVWALSDDTFGTISGGEFTSSGVMGEVEVQVYCGERLVGTRTITVADPEVFTLAAASTVIPYSAPNKVRTISLPIVAMTGEANVYVDTNAVALSLSNEQAGTLEGFTFTATSDTSISGTDVTIAYGDRVLTYTVSFGLGSEVIYDFENGATNGFMGFEEAKKWSQDNGIANTLVGSEPLAGQFNPYLSSKTFAVTEADGGQVRNGNYSLAWRLDNTDAAFASWSYNVLFNTGDTIVLRDVENGKLATSLGMWVYIPQGAPGLAFQSQFYVRNADGTYSCKQDHFMFTSAATGNKTNLNSATEADIPESRWVYASIDISKYDYLCTPVADDTRNSRSPSFIRTYVKPTAPAELTFYIDDITLDYSSAVDDRVLPVVSNPTYSTSDTAVALENGTNVNGTKVAFAANVSDNAALDLTSGKILVDGMEIAAAISGNVLSSQGDVSLMPGEHTVTFSVEDALGNPAMLKRSFTVAGDAVITLTGHNGSGAAPMAQSVYYVDINAADLSKVNKVTAVLKLNNANTWETEGAVTAEGFKATYDYNSVSQLLTVTVEKESEANVTGNTLVRIPVRVWTFDRYNYVTNTYYPVSDMGNRPVVDVICDVVSGQLNGTDAFGGSIHVTTELTTISSPYHEHDTQLTVLNQEVSCGEAGYQNRTYCETCRSVVDWGTVVESAGHDYAVSGDQLVCRKDGTVLEATGLAKADGKVYCLIGGKLVTGWQNVDGEYVYVNASTKEVQVGSVTVDGITYETDDMGIVEGVWVSDAKGMKYSYGPKFHTREWVEIDGNRYYFGTDSYVYTGLRFIVVNRNNIKEGYRVFLFAEDGKLLDEMLDANGIITSPVDGMFYVENGKSVYGGLMLVEGDYYYARTSGEILRNTTYWITKTNDLLPAANYTFGDDGKMIDPPITETPDTPDAPQVKNGIVSEDGKLFWYVDGVKTYAGLMLIDGDYYYARSSGEILTNTTYWITKTNGLLPAANYTFGADGKMVNPPIQEEPDQEEPVVPVVKNGIVEEGGKLWWYVDGVKTYAGLMLIDGDYYYARTSGEILRNTTYWITKTNDLLPAANYTFGADGKMVNPPVGE